MVSLSNSSLTLHGDAGGHLLLEDVRRGVTWRQVFDLPLSRTAETPVDVAPTGVVRDGDTLRQTVVCGGAPVVYTWRLTDDGVEVTVDPGAAADQLTLLALPGSFAPIAGPLHLALPIMQGILWDGSGEAFRQQAVYAGHNHFSMCLIGYLTDRAGLLATMEDPCDWEAEIGKSPAGQVYAGFLLQRSLGRLRSGQPLRLIPTDASVTALCQAYRRRVIARGWHLPWAEKIAARPAVERLFGSLHAFIGYIHSPSTDYLGDARRLRAMGFDRAHIYPVAVADQPARGGLPYDYVDLDADTLAGITALGYDVCAWSYLEDGARGRTPEEILLRRPDGDVHVGWKQDGLEWCAICPTCQPDLMRHNYATDLAAMTWEHYDVTASRRWSECYALDHPGHAGRPLTRTEDMRWTATLLGPELNGDRPVSSEGFRDCLAAHYDIGCTRFLPSLGRFATVPMTQLVWHDCLSHDWWEVHNYNRHAPFDHVSTFGRKVDGEPQLKAAMDALYGEAPNVFPFGKQWRWADRPGGATAPYVVKLDDHAVQEALAAALPVTKLHRRTGPQQLLAHEFLSPDGALQQTVFADGTRVVANFGDAPLEVAGSGVLAPREWRAE